MTESVRRRHLRVLDVMTTRVITADPLDAFKEVAVRLYESGLSALPVVDDHGRVLGVVSGADLVVKEGGDHKGSLLHPNRQRQLTAKAEALVAAQMMTAPAVTISPDASVTEAARMMHQKGVKRLLVVDGDGQLLGIVSRHDVIKTFVRSDESIREEVMEGVFRRDVMIDAIGVSVGVDAGIVSIVGEIERLTEIPIITNLVAAMDGVVEVNNALTYRWDDSHPEYAGTVQRGVAGLL